MKNIVKFEMLLEKGHKEEVREKNVLKKKGKNIESLLENYLEMVFKKTSCIDLYEIHDLFEVNLAWGFP